MTENEQDPVCLLVEKQSLRPAPRRWRLLPLCCPVFLPPHQLIFLLIILGHRAIFTCSPLQWLSPLHPNLNRKLLTDLHVRGEGSWGIHIYLDWEKETGSATFLPCDLEKSHIPHSPVISLVQQGFKLFPYFPGRWLRPNHSWRENVLVNAHASRDLGHHRINRASWERVGEGWSGLSARGRPRSKSV